MATTALALENWFETTLTSGITSTTTTIDLNNLPAGAEGFLVIEPDSEANREVIYYTSKTGSAVVCPSVGAGRGQGGTTNVAHSAGSTVRMNIVDGYWEALQDGTAFKPSAIYDTSNNEYLKFSATASAVNELTVGNAATSGAPYLQASGGDSNIDISLIPKGTGALKVGGNPMGHGAWVDFSPSFANWTIGTGGSAITTAKYTQIGKTVFLRIETILGSSGQSVGTSPSFTLPVTAQYGTANIPISHQCLLNDANGSQVGGVIMLTSSSGALIKYLNAANTEERWGGITSTVPFTWAAGDSITFYAVYEAA